jgi:hypothetical protein
MEAHGSRFPPKATVSRLSALARLAHDQDRCVIRARRGRRRSAFLYHRRRSRYHAAPRGRMPQIRPTGSNHCANRPRISLGVTPVPTTLHGNRAGTPKSPYLPRIRRLGVASSAVCQAESGLLSLPLQEVEPWLDNARIPGPNLIRHNLFPFANLHILKSLPWISVAT